MPAQALGSLDIIIRGPTDQLERDFAKARGAAQQFEQQMGYSARGVVAANDNIARSANQVAAVYGRLRQLAAGLGIGLGIRQIQQLADTWSDLRSRLSNVVGGFDQADQAMTRLEALARRTYSSFQTTAESFIYNARTLKDLGYSTKTQLDFTEALNNALVVSGAKGERAAQVQANLSKAIGQGALRGDELNNILATGGRVASVLADYLTSLGTHGKVTTNDLKRLGQEGILNTSVLVQALVSNLDQLRKEADAMPATIGDAFILIGNAALKFVGITDQGVGLTESLAKKMVALADGISRAAEPAANLLRNLTDLVITTEVVGTSMSDVHEEVRVFGISLDTLGKVATTVFGGILVKGVMTLAGAMAGPLIAAIRGVTVALFTASAAPIVGVFSALLRLFPLLVAGAFAFRKEIAAWLGPDTMNRITQGMQAVVGVFAGGYEGMKAIWAQLPAFFRVIGAQAVNALIDQLSQFQLKASGGGVLGLMGFKEGDTLLDFNPLKGMKIQVDPADQAAVDRTLQETITKGAEAVKGIDLSKLLAGPDKLLSPLDDKDNPISPLSPQQMKAAEKYKDLIEKSREFVQQQELEARALGMTSQAAQALRFEQDMLNQAKQADIALTPAVRAEIKMWAEDMAAAEERTNKLSEAFAFTKDLFSGFVQDLKSGLEQGKGFFESFGAAAKNVLDKIIDKLLNQVIDAIFQVNQAGAGLGGGGGGFISSLISGVGSILGLGGGAAVGAPMNIVPVGHLGMTAGRSFTAFRRMPASAFIGAPRYHGGGIAGEVPALLRRGEPVFQSMAHARSAVGGAAPSMNVQFRVIDNNGNKIKTRQTQEGGIPVLEMVLEAVDQNISNGRFDNSLGGRFGAKTRVTQAG